MWYTYQIYLPIQKFYQQGNTVHIPKLEAVKVKLHKLIVDTQIQFEQHREEVALGWYLWSRAFLELCTGKTIHWTA